MNMISKLRKKITENGEAMISTEDYNQLQSEWIQRCPIDTELKNNIKINQLDFNANATGVFFSATTPFFSYNVYSVSEKLGWQAEYKLGMLCVSLGGGPSTSKVKAEQLCQMHFEQCVRKCM